MTRRTSLSTHIFATPLLLAIAVACVLMIVSCKTGGPSAPPTPVVGSPMGTTTTGSQAATLPATATPTATPQRTPTPLPTPKVELTTTLSTTRYDVRGSNAGEILSYIEAYGPKDDKGQRGLGLASAVWAPILSTTRGSGNSCQLDSVTLKLDLTVTLPNLLTPAQLSASATKGWTGLAADIAAHEQRHVDIYLAGAERLRRELESFTSTFACSAVGSEVQRVINAQQDLTDADQEAFHREDDARLAARRAPLEQQVAANKASLTALETRIGDMDKGLDATRKSLDALEAQLATLKASADQIASQYPSGVLPPDVFTRYESIRQQFDSLLATYNTAVNSHNAALAQRNTLAGQYDSLVTATNTLLEEINWLQ